MHARLLVGGLVGSLLCLSCAVATDAASTSGGALRADHDEDDPHDQNLPLGVGDVEGYHDVDPNMTPEQRAQILARYAQIDHAGVRQALFEDAVLYYDANYERIPNKAYLSVLDFAKHSGERRFFELDMGGGPIKKHKVAHGKQSDPNNTGFATLFSNVPESNKSSVGYYVTAETYDGAHGESLRLDGLSKTNSNVRDRYIVIHEGDYVSDDFSKQGRSLGCIVFSPLEKPAVVARLKEGSIIYAMN